ncbi:MAG: hypothetical protein CME66_01005 [Halobacteriovoraceae bacterium]|nr:hypothetical protein [Halobacteriovoraceae bacterium]
MKNLSRVNEVFQRTAFLIGLYGHHTKKGSSFDDKTIFDRIQNVDLETLRQICISFESYNEIIASLPSKGESISSVNKRHLKKFLNKWGLRVDQRVFDGLTDEYLVEVYSTKHQQLFRSANFFSMSGYTLSELTFSPWDELFHRSISNDDIMFKTIDMVLDYEIKYLVPKISHHILTEIKTKRKFKYQMVKLACVFDDIVDVPVGYLTIISVKELKGKLRLIN